MDLQIRKMSKKRKNVKKKLKIKIKINPRYQIKKTKMMDLVILEILMTSKRMNNHKVKIMIGQKK